MSNIRIDIASEFKEKGFKQADKATTGLDRKLSALGKTLVGVLSVRAITQFGKASVRAFSEDEQAASRLSQSLKNLGLAFEDARVSQFISDLEAASGVLDDSLRPAMQSLLMTTGSVAKSQELMALALDMSRASGIDVATVSKDLSKAYVGQTRSLSKYNIGLSQVELRTKSFAELQEILQSQFTGQSAAFLDTYAGKVSVLNVAYANMQETIGEGLVDAFMILSGDSGIGGGVSAMDRFGDAVADTTRGIARLIDTFTDLSGYLPMLREFGTAFLREGNIFGAFRSLGKPKPAPFTQPMTIAGSTDRQTQIDRARAKAEAEAAKRQKELVALTKKQVKAQEALNKKKKEEGILGEIAKRFELDRIQIAAALGGKINDVERLRLELMQAILDEDVKRAIILEGQLIKAEAAALELANLLDSLDEMVDDPFADWPGTIARIKELLKTLNIKIPIETLFAEKGLKLDQEKMTVTKLERMDVQANNVYINGTLDKDAPISLASAQANAVLAEAAVVDADALLAESAAAAGLIDANSMLADSLLALLKTGAGDDITINVTVEGNVTTQQDLTDAITDNLYQYQKTGKGLIFSSVAI